MLQLLMDKPTANESCKVVMNYQHRTVSNENNNENRNIMHNNKQDKQTEVCRDPTRKHKTATSPHRRERTEIGRSKIIYLSYKTICNYYLKYMQAWIRTEISEISFYLRIFEVMLRASLLSLDSIFQLRKVT